MLPEELHAHTRPHTARCISLTLAGVARGARNTSPRREWCPCGNVLSSRTGCRVSGAPRAAADHSCNSCSSPLDECARPSLAAGQRRKNMTIGRGNLTASPHTPGGAGADAPESPWPSPLDRSVRGGQPAPWAGPSPEDKIYDDDMLPKLHLHAYRGEFGPVNGRPGRGGGAVAGGGRLASHASRVRRPRAPAPDSSAGQG